MEIFRIVLLLLVLALGIFVALSPKVVYAPVPRVTLFFLISLLFAILFGAEAVAKLKLELPGFSFVTAGASALCLGSLWILTKLAKPEEMIAVFHVFDESGNPVNLEWPGAFQVPLSSTGLRPTTLATGNTLVFIFPEQIGEVDLIVKKTAAGSMTYSGSVGFTGTRQIKLQLGKDLVQHQR